MPLPMPSVETIPNNELPFQSTTPLYMHILESSLVTQIKYHQKNHFETEEILEFEHGKEEHSI